MIPSRTRTAVDTVIVGRTVASVANPGLVPLAHAGAVEGPVVGPSEVVGGVAIEAAFSTVVILAADTTFTRD